MFRIAILRDSDMEQLADGVFAVLEDIGILCQSEEIMRALEEGGARVDHESERVKFPRRMAAVAQVPQQEPGVVQDLDPLRLGVKDQGLALIALLADDEIHPGP